MKNENDLSKKIIDITMQIQKKHPELSKYLTEMPETIPIDKSPEVNIISLESYLNSLETILSKYELELNQKNILLNNSEFL